MTTGSIAGPKRDVAPPAGTGRERPPVPLDVLSLGMSWFPEQAGNGLDRVYHELLEHLAGAGVSVRGLVAGTPAVAGQSGGRVRAFDR